MKLRFVVLSALLSSSLAAAADAPSVQMLTECKLEFSASLAEIGKLTSFSTESDGDIELDGYHVTRTAYKISTRPYGLTGLELVHMIDDDDDYGITVDTLETDVSESYDVAKATLLAANGASQCSSETGDASNRICSIPRAGLPTLYLNEAKGLTFFACDL